MYMYIVGGSLLYIQLTENTALAKRSFSSRRWKIEICELSQPFDVKVKECPLKRITLHMPSYLKYNKKQLEILAEHLRVVLHVYNDPVSSAYRCFWTDWVNFLSLWGFQNLNFYNLFTTFPNGFETVIFTLWLYDQKHQFIFNIWLICLWYSSYLLLRLSCFRI